MPTYANVIDVRTEAGLSDNIYITDEQIGGKLDQAESEVNASLVIGGYTLPLSSTPGMVKNATLLLAAGYLLVMDYGVEHTGTNKDGQAKIKMAREILAKIEDGQLQLIDGETGTPIGQHARVRGYPDATAETNIPSEARMFSVTDKF